MPKSQFSAPFRNRFTHAHDDTDPFCALSHGVIPPKRLFPGRSVHAISPMPANGFGRSGDACRGGSFLRDCDACSPMPEKRRLAEMSEGECGKRGWRRFCPDIERLVPQNAFGGHRYGRIVVCRLLLPSFCGRSGEGGGGRSESRSCGRWKQDTHSPFNPLSTTTPLSPLLRFSPCSPKGADRGAAIRTLWDGRCGRRGEGYWEDADGAGRGVGKERQGGFGGAWRWARLGGGDGKTERWGGLPGDA